MIPFTQFQVIPEIMPTDRKLYRVFGLDENGIIWTSTVQAFQLDSENNIPENTQSPGMQGMRWKKVPTP